MDEILKWAPIAFTLVNAVFALIVFAIGKSLVSREEHIGLDKRVIILEQRRFPGWTSFDGISGRLGAIEGDVKAILASQKATEESQHKIEKRVERIEDFLFTTGSRG